MLSKDSTVDGYYSTPHLSLYNNKVISSSTSANADDCCAGCRLSWIEKLKEKPLLTRIAFHVPLFNSKYPPRVLCAPKLNYPRRKQWVNLISLSYFALMLHQNFFSAVSWPLFFFSNERRSIRAKGASHNSHCQIVIPLMPWAAAAAIQKIVGTCFQVSIPTAERIDKISIKLVATLSPFLLNCPREFINKTDTAP